jgi:DNA-binding XRE family transcriptional regulator
MKIPLTMNDIAFILVLTAGRNCVHSRKVVKSMHKNLRAEMVRIDVKPADIAQLLGVRYATVIDKLNGRYGFTLKEALKIKRKYFPEHNIEYLFENEDDKSA